MIRKQGWGLWRKRRVMIGSMLVLAGCIHSKPEEVITDSDGPSTGAIIGEEMDGIPYVFTTDELQETKQITAFNQLHYSKRIVDTFRVLGDYAGVQDKVAQGSTIRYTGEVYEQLDEILSVYWFEFYQVVEREADQQSPMNFELTVDAETKWAEKLTVITKIEENTDTATSFTIEFNNIKEGTLE